MADDITFSFPERNSLRDWEVVAVTPLKVTDLDRWAEGALERGATLLVLRLMKPPKPDDLWRWAERWKGVRWLWHSRCGPNWYGHGKHFSAFAPIPAGRPFEGYLLGRSCHNLLELEEAASWADYVWLGPFFETASHPGAAVLSWDVLTEAAQKWPDLPIIAIGGFTTAERMEVARQQGARGIASIGYFLKEKVETAI